MTTVHKTCNLCEATCGLLIELDSDRVVSIRGDDDDPFSRGHICPKAVGLREVHEDPDRLRYPVRRTHNGWQPITWEEAGYEVASRLSGLQRDHGADAVATYLGNPGAHNFGTIFYLSSLYRALPTRNRYAASSLDQNPAHASSLYLFGGTLTIPIPDLDRTDFLLMLGANPLVSNGSLMTAPGMRRRLRELRDRGGKLVVVDPRRTETAKVADVHHFIRPGADAWLLASLLAVVFEEGRTRENNVWSSLVGLDALKAAVAPFSPEAVGGAVGMSSDAIRELARDFAAAGSAVCYGRVGICLNPFGTLNSWLATVLNIVTGNLDQPGGSMFPTPAIDIADLARRTGTPPDDWKTRVRGAPSFNGEQPTACLAEEITTPGEGQVRGLLTIAGNPVLSAPNGRALDEALSRLDFFAAVDFYVNETTRHAHVILPPTDSLEHDNYEVLFHLFAVRNTAKYSRPVVAPALDTRDEWQILTDLALRLGQQRASGRAARLGFAALRGVSGFFSPRRLMDWSLRLGPYGDGFRPWRRGLRLSDLEASRKGVDLGPLVPSLARVLHTPSKTIDLGHPTMLAELARARDATGEAALREGLVLIGRRDVRTNNSWLHNVPVGAKGRDRCTLIVHPRDAERLGLDAGQLASINSRVGAVQARVEISGDVMPGVVCLPHGWGHDRNGAQLRVAETNPGVSYNDVSDDQLLESVVGNAVLNGIPVTVAAAEP